MIELSVSVVVYEPDLALLANAIASLQVACRHASVAAPLACSLDIVNNRPGDPHLNEIFALAQSCSRDGLPTTVIESRTNGGYGAGNNLSIKRHGQVDFHLVLNPDVLLDEAALTHSLAYMQANPTVGLLTPQVRGFDGELQRLCKRHPTLLDMFLRSVPSTAIRRLFRERTLRYEMRDHDYQAVIRPVPYPTGCFMLFRRSTLACIGGFDERYFLHYEDADIGRHVDEISVTAYVPDVVVLHKWSRDSHKSWRMRWVTIQSGLRYWRKWGGTF